MTEQQLNPPKKERVWIVPATMNKYSFGKSELMELGRGYEAQLVDLDIEIKALAKAGMTAINLAP